MRRAGARRDARTSPSLQLGDAACGRSRAPPSRRRRDRRRASTGSASRSPASQSPVSALRPSGGRPTRRRPTRPAPRAGRRERPAAELTTIASAARSARLSDERDAVLGAERQLARGVGDDLLVRDPGVDLEEVLVQPEQLLAGEVAGHEQVAVVALADRLQRGRVDVDRPADADRVGRRGDRAGHVRDVRRDVLDAVGDDDERNRVGGRAARARATPSWIPPPMPVRPRGSSAAPPAAAASWSRVPPAPVASTSPSGTTTSYWSSKETSASSSTSRDESRHDARATGRASGAWSARCPRPAPCSRSGRRRARPRPCAAGRRSPSPAR